MSKVTMTTQVSDDDAQRADNAAELIKLKPADLLRIGLERVLREIETTGGLIIPPVRLKKSTEALAKRLHPLFGDLDSGRERCGESRNGSRGRGRNSDHGMPRTSRKHPLFGNLVEGRRN